MDTDDLDIDTLVSMFSDFFMSTYMKIINELLAHYPEQKSLEVDYKDLELYDDQLADFLIKNPDLGIKAAESAIEDMNLKAPGTGFLFKPHVRIFNHPDVESRLIEDLTSIQINTLVGFKGVITRRGDMMHQVIQTMYRCMLCDAEVRVEVEKNFIPPKRCPECKKMTLAQVEEQNVYEDYQRAEIQELLERVTGGAPAAHIQLELKDDLVNSIAPGDNVEAVGILRVRKPIKAKQSNMVYLRYIEVINVRSLRKDFEEIEITSEEEAQIIDLSKNPNIEHIFVESFALGIYGHTEVKKALLLQLFGGTKGKIMPGGLSIRDQVHVLLIGDPGISKTRFLQFVTAIAPKSIYASGKGTSGVGLTVAAEKDELSDGGWTLKAGALVLANGGIVCVDEFDKINEDNQAALHEVMESGQISVAKAGIVARFNAKTSVLAAANPKYGRFDQTKNLADQFNISPTLLSRFDLIFPIVDVLDEEKDIKLAKHILKTHRRDPEIMQKAPIDTDMLRKYIAYARRHVNPELSQAAADKIEQFYIDLRRMGKDMGSVAITPRYLEGLVRLAESNAKLRLSNIVEEHDSDMAIELMNYVMKQVMIDRQTGAFDADIIATGMSKTDRDKKKSIDTIMDIVREILKTYDSAGIKLIIEEAERYGVDKHTAERMLAELIKRGELYEHEHGHVRIP